MKKIFTLTILTLLGISSFAQKKWHMSVNLSTATPATSAFGDLWKIGLGSSLRFEYSLNNHWDFTGELGGNIHAGKELSMLFWDGNDYFVGNVTYPNIGVYNYRVGARFRAFNEFYFTSDIGMTMFATDKYATILDPATFLTYQVPVQVSGSDFSLSHGIGYLFKLGENNGIDLGLRFDWCPGNQLASYQFRAGYRFGL